MLDEEESGVSPSFLMGQPSTTHMLVGVHNVVSWRFNRWCIEFSLMVETKEASRRINGPSLGAKT
jgi:hypothetical protein